MFEPDYFENPSKEMNLKVKCALAYLRWNEAAIPDHETLVDSVGLRVYEDRKHVFEKDYDAAKEKVESTEVRLAMNSRVIEARGGFVMQKDETMNFGVASETKYGQRSLRDDIEASFDEDHPVVQFLNEQCYDSDTIRMDVSKENSVLKARFGDEFEALSAVIANTQLKGLASDIKQDFSEYRAGHVMRYDVMEPVYGSFAEESIMNDVGNISASTFYKHLQTALSLMEKVNLTATESSKRFGIRKHQKVDVRHVLAIVIYTAETRYCHELNRSFWTESGLDIHSQNFYWFGRFLFEAIEFFGECFNDRLDGDTAKILQGASKLFTFDNFAPSVHYPRSTTSSMKVALQFSSKEGCVLELIPKYSGILNSSKFVDVSGMSKYEDEQEKYDISLL